MPEDSYNGEYGCPTTVGPPQMQHFATKDSFNVFRLPVAWQSLVNNDLVTNDLDADFWEEYDGIVQACLATGAHCMYDTCGSACPSLSWLQWLTDSPGQQCRYSQLRSLVGRNCRSGRP